MTKNNIEQGTICCLKRHLLLEVGDFWLTVLHTYTMFFTNILDYLKNESSSETLLKSAKALSAASYKTCGTLCVNFAFYNCVHGLSVLPLHPFI